MKKFLAIVILVFLLTSLVSCNNEVPPVIDPIETDAPETNTPETEIPESDAPQTDTPNPDPLTTNAPETAAPVVFEYTPSLSSNDEIEKIGVQIGDVIVELYHTGMNGQLYFEIGMDPAFVDGYSPKIEDMPVLKLSAGEKITVVNNMGYGNIQDTEYFILNPESPYELPQMLTGSEDSVAYPEAPGKYIAKIPWSYYVWNDPSNPTPEELIGRLSGHMTFYCILVVE